MEKASYEVIKGMRERAKNGKASFAERNILRIIDKRIRKRQSIRAPKPSYVLPV